MTFPFTFKIRCFGKTRRETAQSENIGPITTPGPKTTRGSSRKGAVQDSDDVSHQNFVRVRTQFLRNVAHRIDTDTLRRLTRSSSKFREISENVKIPDFVSTIYDVGEEYAAVLESVLKYYDCVNGTFVTVDGPLLLRNIISDAKTDAVQQMLRVSEVPPLVDIDITPSVPISELIGDAQAIKECLQELIFNALRHDNDTHASVCVSAMSHHPCHVTFVVENKGIQIMDDDMMNIFTPFKNIHPGIVHGSGLGIGLAKCQMIARKMGGEINVQNGETTIFSMTLPMKHQKDIRVQIGGMSLSYERRSSEVKLPSEIAEGLDIFPTHSISPLATRPSILVVDDSAVARRQFQKILVNVGIDVDLCIGPRECLITVESKVYDAIFLDIIMPVMSGVTCAHHVREGQSGNKNSPIIIITADNSTQTRQLCSNIEHSMVLEKPAKPNVLYRTIMSCITDSNKKEWMRKEWHKKNMRANLVR